MLYVNSTTKCVINMFMYNIIILVEIYRSALNALIERDREDMCIVTHRCKSVNRFREN